MAIASLPTFDQGVIREKRMSRQALKKAYTRSVNLAYNCDFRQKIGAIKARKGSRKIGANNATASEIVLGGGVLDSLAYNRPFGVWEESGNAVLKYFDGSGYQTASGFPTTATEYDFAQLGGRLFVVGASVMYESDSLATFTSSEDRGCVQLQAGVVWTMGSRVFISQIPGRPGYVGFSSIWNPAGYDSVATKNITWNTDFTSGDFLVVNPDDGGGEVVGGIFTGNTYLIFKERATYMYRKAQVGVEPDSFLSVGACNKNAYTACQGYAFFFSSPVSKTSGTESGGFYQTNGSSLRDIGWPIQDILDGVTDPDVVSVSSDEDSIYVYLGDVSIDDFTYANVVVVYSVKNDAWEGPHSFPYDDMRLFRGKTFGLMAQTKQKIVQLETDDITDDGTPIDFIAESNPIQLVEEVYLKNLSYVGVYTQNAKDTAYSIQAYKRGSVVGDRDIPINSDFEGQHNPIPDEWNYYIWRWKGTKSNDNQVFEGAVMEYEQKGLNK